MRKVITVHGFQSSSEAMKEFTRVVDNAAIFIPAAKNITVYDFEWFSGRPLSTMTHALEFLFSPRQYADRTIETWSQAEMNIAPAATELARMVNALSEPSDTILLVAHSMGTQVVLESLSLIDKKNHVFLFLMGGISDVMEYESIADYENIKGIINSYSTADMMLDKFLDQISFYSKDAVGCGPIDNRKVNNIKTDFGHSDYLQSSQLLNIIYLKHCLGIDFNLSNELSDMLATGINAIRKSLQD